MSPPIELDETTSIVRAPSTEPLLFHSRVRRFEGAATNRAWGIKLACEGQETYRVGGQSYTIGPGQFIVTAPNQRFEVGIASTHDVVGLCIDLPASWFEGGEEEHPLGAFSAEEGELGARLTAAWKATRAGAPLRLGSALAHAFASWSMHHRSIMSRLPGRRVGTRSRLYGRLERARNHLLQHLDRPVGLAELAQHSAVAPHHLNRLFKRAYGEPPSAYHRQQRMKRAIALLEAGATTVTHVAQLIGYADTATFSRAFRGVTGRPPSHYLPAS